MLRLGVLFAAVGLFAAASGTACEKSIYDWWTEDVKAGDRGFLVEGNEHGAQFSCSAKGTNAADEVLDPVVSNFVSLGYFQQSSRMPCQLFAERFDKADVQPGMFLNQSSSPSPMNSSCDTLGAPATCTYPRADLGQNSWGGVSFKISRVNDKHTTEGDTPGVAYEPPYNALNRTITHAPVFGGSESSCALAGGSSTSLYSSGVVLSGNPLPDDMKYKVYAFASESERQLALADARNDGLQYAREMTGENGCDVEIVYEFFPQPGGGLMVEISQTMSGVTEAMQRAITDSTSAYVIPEQNIAVVQVSKNTLRENQYLPLRDGCDDGMESTVKFSTQFICKATGQRVNIDRIKMSRTSPNGKTVEDISTDPSNPTTFQTDPANPTDCYYKMECGGFQHEPDFELHMDPTSAPESCGSFYWDPLVHAVPGDGQSASAISSNAGSGSTSGSTSGTQAAQGSTSGSEAPRDPSVLAGLFVVAFAIAQN
jgi:hypothetical protein